MTTGERIKHRRKELNLTQEELAHRLGNKTRASVCTVEKGKEDLTTERIKKYAEALETTPAYLMGWTENPDQDQLKADYEATKQAMKSDSINNEMIQLLKGMSEEQKERILSYARFMAQNED